MKTITILGETLNIAFNMATQIAYEKITDKAFSIADLDRTDATLSLMYAAIVANNPETALTMDDLLHKASCQDITLLKAAVIDAMQDWCHVPATMEQQQAAEEGKEPNP
jgi:hypothetical protein